MKKLWMHEFPILIELGPWQFQRRWHLSLFSFIWLSEKHFIRFSPIFYGLNISCIISNHKRGGIICIASKTGSLLDQKHISRKYFWGSLVSVLAPPSPHPDYFFQKFFNSLPTLLLASPPPSPRFYFGRVTHQPFAGKNTC